MPRNFRFFVKASSFGDLFRLVTATFILVGSNPKSVIAQPVARRDTVIFELSKPVEQATNFNWYFPSGRRDQGAHQAMWEPLFLLNYNTGKLDPWLATDIIANSTQDVWTLTLRKDAKWSDGVSFTAEDVLFTVRMVIDPKNETMSALEAVTLREQVESVTNVGDLNVVFKLRKPNPRFALENFGGALFSSFLVMPAHIWKGQDPETFTFSAPIGTGPYKLSQATKTKTTWLRDDNWWGIKAGFQNLPEPVQLIWQVFDNETKSKEALVANNLDAGREYTLSTFLDAKNSNTKIVGWDHNSSLAWNDPCARQIDINTQREPWKEPRLRKALSLLIDRTRLAHIAYKDTVQPSSTMFAQYGAMKPYIDKVVAAGLGVSPTADVVAAQALLQEAGYQKGVDGFYAKNGVPLGATILVNADLGEDVDAANELAAQLIEGGLKIRIESIPNAEYWGKAVPTGGYEMVYGWLSCGSVAEPYTSMSRYTVEKAVPIGQRSPGFSNTGRWDTKAARDYSAVVETMGRLQVRDANIPSQVVSAYRFVDQEMPFIPLVQSPRIIPFNTTYWTGWPVLGGSSVPMHSWSSIQRIIYKLTKAS